MAHGPASPATFHLSTSGSIAILAKRFSHKGERGRKWTDRSQITKTHTSLLLDLIFVSLVSQPSTTEGRHRWRPPPQNVICDQVVGANTTRCRDYLSREEGVLPLHTQRVCCWFGKWAAEKMAATAKIRWKVYWQGVSRAACFPLPDDATVAELVR